MKNKKILITGGSGFIGSHLSNLLLGQDHEVIILDLVQSKINHPKLKYVQGDIRKESDLSNVITPDIDAIFHFAAIVSVPECEQQPQNSFDTNLAATQKILQRLVELKPKKNIPIFFASSAAVYGDLCKPGQQLSEDDHLPQPRSFYGLHKYSAEQSIRLYCKSFGILGLSFRFFNVHGPGQKVDSPYSGVITIFQKAFDTNGEIKLYNHGNNTRDFIHVSEIARACSLSLDLNPTLLDGSPVNLCTGKSVSIKDVFKRMSNQLHKQVTTVELPPREGDIEYSCGDNSRAYRLLNFQTNNQFLD